MTKLLTISIPTWNRELLLKELLFDLTQQITQFSLEDSIEILISDNNSEDNTWQLINDYQSKFNFISSNRNLSNVGAKSNVLKSMELAHSEFVLFLGDDDRIRKDCLPELLSILKGSSNLGVLVDISKYKYKEQLKPGYQEYSTFLENLYWYMGNAGYFVCRTIFFKSLLQKYGYDFFNECWPHTQIMILGMVNSNQQPFAKDLIIPIESKHDQVMLYSSYYLWRTCVYDLLISINDIKSLIPLEIFNACRHQMKIGIRQNFLNILQCGVFVDDLDIKRRTRNDILNKLNLFSLKEIVYLIFITFALSLPGFISKFFSNLFIGLTKGKSGLAKKNTFVNTELLKKKLKSERIMQIRSLEFEK